MTPLPSPRSPAAGRAASPFRRAPALVLGALLGGLLAATAAPLAGYLTVWALCGGTAVLSAIVLAFVPKLAFADRVDAAPEIGANSTVR